MKRQACRQAGKLAGCLSRLADRQVARGGVVVRSSAMQKRLSFLAVCSLLIQVPLRNALLFSSLCICICALESVAISWCTASSKTSIGVCLPRLCPRPRPLYDSTGRTWRAASPSEYHPHTCFDQHGQCAGLHSGCFPGFVSLLAAGASFAAATAAAAAAVCP